MIVILPELNVFSRYILFLYNIYFNTFLKSSNQIKPCLPMIALYRKYEYSSLHLQTEPKKVHVVSLTNCKESGQLIIRGDNA